MKRYITRLTKLLLLTLLLMVGTSVQVQGQGIDRTANLALNKEAVARDRWDGDGGIYEAAKAVDGNTGTSWMATPDGPGIGSWLYVDLGQQYVLNQVKIQWQLGRWPNGAWKVQVATTVPDAEGVADWVDVYVGNRATSPITCVFNNYIAGRYVRFIGETQAMSYGYHITEFEVYGLGEYNAAAGDALTDVFINPSATSIYVRDELPLAAMALQATNFPFDGATYAWSVTSSNAATASITENGIFSATATGEYTVTCEASAGAANISKTATITVEELPPFVVSNNLALNQSATSSSTESSPAVGNDGDINTRWRSSNANETEWWAVDLGRLYVVNNVKVLMNGDAGAREATYEIQVSLNGTEWQTVVADGMIPAGGGQESSNHFFDGVPVRYVKYNGLTNGGWDHNFAELQVYGTGYYDPAAGTDLESVLIVHSYSAFYANESYTFRANAINGQSQPVEDATIAWSVTDNQGAPTTDASINASTGVFIATVPATYKIVSTATSADNTIVVADELEVTVLAARVATTLTFAQTKVNNPVSNASNIFLAGQAVPFTIEVRDQYANVLTDAIIEYETTSGGIVDPVAKTVVWTELGAATVTAKIAATALEESFDVNIIANQPIAKTGWTASASTSSVQEGANLTIDNNVNTRWISGTATVAGTPLEESVTIDLGTLYLLDAVEVIWEGATASQYDIEVSADNTVYRTIGGENRALAIYNHLYRAQDGVQSPVQYIRISCHVPASQYRYSIFEISAYGSLAPLTWTGAGDPTNWSDPQNWSTGVAPTAINDIIIPVSATYPTIPDGTSIKSLTFEAGAGLNIATGGSVTVTEAIHVEYVMDKEKWYSVGFPFAINHLYNETYGELKAYNAGKGHYWLKEYNGATNLFDYTQTILADQGYIVQIPEQLNGQKITFVALPPNEDGIELQNERALNYELDNYVSRANPNVIQHPLTVDTENYHYTYDEVGNKYVLVTASTAINPFEAVITVKKTAVSAQHAPLRSSIGDGSGVSDGTTPIELPQTIGDQVVSVRYYTLQGIEVKNPVENNIYLVKTRYASQKETVVKTLYTKNKRI